MKITLSLLLLSVSTLITAQTCIRSGSLTETDVSISGTASLIHRGDSMVVQLGTDFISQSGPDLDVYLSNEPNPISTGIRLEALKALSGEQFYNVPREVGIEDYKYITIHCTYWEHLYGYASLDDASGECSVALSNADVKINEVRIFTQNDLINIKSIDAGFNNYRVEIFNQSGQLLKSSLNYEVSYAVDLPGLYFVRLITDNTIRTEKVIIK